MIKLKLPVKPLSKNKLKMPIRVGGRARLAKTPQAREYEKIIEQCLMAHSKEIKEFMRAHNKAMGISAIYRIYVPEKVFWTREGYLSQRSIDVTNATEALQDIVTNYMGFDDSQIIKAEEIKIPSDEWGIEITYTLTSLKLIRSFPFRGL